MIMVLGLIYTLANGLQPYTQLQSSGIILQLFMLMAIVVAFDILIIANNWKIKFTHASLISKEGVSETPRLNGSATMLEGAAMALS